MSAAFKRIMLSLTMIILALSTIVTVRATNTVDEWNLTAEKTGIKCTGAYNVSGYAVVTFYGPYEVGGQGNDWPWYGLVDSNGKYVIAAKPMMEDPRMNTYGDTFFINDGIICDYRRGYYNINGNKAFDMYLYKPSKITDGFVDMPVALPFSNGYTLIQYNINTYEDGGGQGWFNSDASPLYLVDKNGNIVREFMHNDWMYYGGDGMYVITDFYTYAQYFDYQGNKKVDLSGRGYARFGTFKDGYAWVGLSKSGPYGYVNSTGTEVISCIYDDVGLFNDGLAAVRIGSKWGYINTSGETVIPIEYDKAYGAGGGLVNVGKDGKQGFADYNNNVVYMDYWDDLSSFEGGVAYGVKNGELYIIKNGPAKKHFDPATVLIITGVGAGIAGAGVLIAKSAGSAAAAGAAKAAVKKIKVKFGHRTVLVISKDEKLVSFLKKQANLKIRTCKYDEISEKIKDEKPDLVLTEIESDQQLDNYISANLKHEQLKHGFLLSENISSEKKTFLEELRKANRNISFSSTANSPYKIMTELVLPVLKPQVSSDASLANIGSVADALGIPFISQLLDVYSTGRDLKNTIEESEGDIGTDETVSIINDIASILGIEDLKEVTDVISDIKKVKKAVKNDGGAYEAKEGVKGAKDIVDTLMK